MPRLAVAATAATVTGRRVQRPRSPATAMIWASPWTTPWSTLPTR